jgi:hypothetical protein
MFSYVTTKPCHKDPAEPYALASDGTIALAPELVFKKTSVPIVVGGVADSK